MGRARGESLWPNNGSLESMHVSCFHRGKTVICTLSSNFYEEKQNKTKQEREKNIKTSVLYCILRGALVLVDQEANTSSSTFVFYFHAEKVFTFLLPRTKSLY